MPAIIVVSAEPNAGLATVAAGLSRLAGAGIDVTPIEGNASAALATNPGARAVLVATPASPAAEVVGQLRSGSYAGLILNHSPARKVESIHVEYESLGVKPLAIVPEDRLLAAPTVGQFAKALDATGEFINENRDRSLARTVIASIAADPGQTYVTQLEAQAVIVRSDKPDLQLSALNAGARCLIVTGNLPILSYVLDRVREDEIPLIRSPKDTKDTVAVLEGLFGASLFTGSEKTDRIATLLAGVDVDALLQRATNSA